VKEPRTQALILVAIQLVLVEFSHILSPNDRQHPHDLLLTVAISSRNRATLPSQAVRLVSNQGRHQGPPNQQENTPKDSHPLLPPSTSHSKQLPIPFPPAFRPALVLFGGQHFRLSGHRSSRCSFLPPDGRLLPLNPPFLSFLVIDPSPTTRQRLILRCPTLFCSIQLPFTSDHPSFAILGKD
jgi:hypothetical protein